MTAGTLAPGNCRRCSRPPVRNHDELVCFTHGLIADPIRGGDLVDGFVGPDAPRSPGGKPIAPRAPLLPVTESERQAWARMEAGEDVPESRGVECPRCSVEFSPLGIGSHMRNAHRLGVAS
ncbi:MAG: hypothetical protein HY873_13255 [Chloroflexi bacterium]|nr:hypothetical protein [Chloroflexota bacterium]